jgi:hypothetical protein
MLVCSGTTVSCVRGTDVAIANWEDPSAPRDVVSWGYWGGVYDTIEINGDKYTLAQANANAIGSPAGMLTKNGATVKLNNAAKQLTITKTFKYNGEQGESTQTWTVLIAAHYLVVSIPNADAYYQTNGLCGLYDGDHVNEFTHEDGTVAIPNVAKNTRYNNAAINAWGASFTVGATRNIKPLKKMYFHQNEKFEIYPFEGTMNASVPTPAEQAKLDEIKMDWATYVEVERQCREASPNDVGAYENCVYDAIHLAESIHKNSLIASNLQASLAVSQLQNIPASETLAPGEIAGIVVGCFMAVAIGVAVFMWFRVRSAKSELQALIPHATAGTTPAGISL